jgi:hypothetical protein
MENADRALSAIDHDDGKAVGGLNGEQEAGRIGEEAIACGRFIGGCGDRMNDVGVNLTERHERPGMAASDAQLG